MENLDGKEGAKAKQDGHGSSQSVRATFKMPISKDDLEPIPLHIVKSCIWYERSEPSNEEENKEGEEAKSDFFLKFSPNSERNMSIARRNAVSLRYFNSYGTLDCIALPNVDKEDIRVELHEQQITLFALARDQPENHAIQVDEIIEPSRIYTFNTAVQDVYSIVAGFRKGQFQLFRGVVTKITERSDLRKFHRRKKIPIRGIV